ncbi:MAG: formate dehydrogenase accessory sulfurtransferase FdhD [Anaerolineae bacterium]|nr:formate dehydrogenase accessory sulfurtransferase FdhD [Anaerolineae bacterium]
MSIRISDRIQSRGAVAARYYSLNGATPQVIDGELVEEGLACISINGEELATFMCSPRDLDKLALGFLLNEGIISGLDDVADLRVADNGACVDVWLTKGEWSRPQRTIITAGCGGGITFDDLSQMHAPLEGTAQATPEQLAEMMRQMHLGAALYQRARGIHTAALADGEKILLQVEDLGRHNCLDKLRGAAILEGVETMGKIVLSSGRISSEMINKARQLGTPIVCSRTSPTSLSVALAEAWNITIVAYLRQDRMRVYTHPERVLGSERMRDWE